MWTSGAEIVSLVAESSVVFEEVCHQQRARALDRNTEMVENTMPHTQRLLDLISSISANPIATIITDNQQNDNPIVAANDAFLRMTGYAIAEVIGRNCRFLAGTASEPEVQTGLRRAIEEGLPAVVELWNYRKDGSPFRNALMIAPVRDQGGKAVFFMGTQMEVIEHSSHGFGSSQARRRALGLTPKQRLVLSLMTNGHRDNQIGEQLSIGSSAVKRLRRRLLDRLGVSTTADAIRIGVQAGLAPR